MNPKLRPLDIRPVRYSGEPYLLLRDPLQLSQHQLLVPQALAAVLAFCDGEHDVPAMVEAFRAHYTNGLPTDAVEELLAALDEISMLENERSVAMHDRALAEYRQAPFRVPALAGASYPAEQEQLSQMLQDYLEAAGSLEPLSVDWSHPVGLLSPHIDYQRGGAVYAQIWKRAAQIAREAELVVIFGTDHYGSDLFTLTRQDYATPYGVLPTDKSIVDRLAAIIGVEAAFAGELRHQGEHALELVTNWLHHARAGAPAPVVPILVGSFYPFIAEGTVPAEHPVVDSVLRTLQKIADDRRLLVIASGDLAHCGPAFGGTPLSHRDRDELRAADEELVTAMRNGDAAAFFASVARVQDRNNVCGVAPIYLTMRLLNDLPGKQAGYATCPADATDTSVVTVTGMLFA